MSVGEPSGGPGGAKLIGLGLIGVGVLAAVLGTVTLMSGESSDTAQPLPQEPTSQVQSPPEPAPSPVVPPVQPPPVQPPAQTAPVQPPPVVDPPQSPQPGSGTGQAPGSGQSQDIPVGSGKGSEQIIVRVYNNSTISGLAHRAAEDLRKAGYDVPEVGNYAAGKIPTTTVYFRPGSDEERQAKELAAKIGARVETRFDGIQDATPGLIAIITNDYKGPSAGK
ncbi:LytR C-terminal domain-containing protein [Saccharopolyspora dendranthemae]|uniref:LytR cell envelope-related transcriptional attenuator n=1 Tax=Saccharopolyspora dendranthemae TaxID=1181886 RepID=A0A561TZC4_9PSEU|nr:LytR C-terminal domain-containing protein [Saccharopolyspora dendranthemae]TWF92454.1 LytR cell envelope-related transcriptional attenuator [Saccharopolyspora dendranthemae]